ncbi:MAG: hypothetical protein A2V85_01065 [Chloroflexi bacterium RBG_16_72_14]|nr:MAG: hypothetical protein A2V85_01065 [Chloroflexi bacterium RBG_16_72_14]
MRLDTQDQLTAVARFLDDAWRAVQSGRGDVSFAVVRAAFDAWADDPTERGWNRLRESLALASSDIEADRILADLTRYVGRVRDNAPER